MLADPVLFDASRCRGRDPALVYLQLHGWPRAYRSAYPRKVIDALAVRLRLAAESAAAGDALYIMRGSGKAVIVMNAPPGAQLPTA